MARNKSSHWIDGPNEMSRAAMGYFGVTDRSQEIVLSFLHNLVPFRSAVDFGTGRGTWLRGIMNLGILDIRGYDIPEIPVEERRFPAQHFVAADLGEPIDTGRRFDLAISTEVAEHIPRERARRFVANVAEPADLVLFSAAIPYQGGAGHVNENWAEYWAKMFSEQGFTCFDILRLPFWTEASIRSYYRQNLLVFARGETIGRLQAAGHQPVAIPPSLIHPEQFLKAIGRALPPELATVGIDVCHYYDCVTKTPAEVDADLARPVYGKRGVGWGAMRRHLGL